ncbi:hypothetical protein GCM10008014_32260 [Paenibacillus silvae]|uniref:Uncharacterized protein n=1 Tax=Paenibacillus silvae TaxID=1325358 RepID=A0ABQ1ZCY9_9BACL|nr:hypothetical protein GCM10008014_32260 [Paenibacillus silvae]
MAYLNNFMSEKGKMKNASTPRTAEPLPGVNAFLLRNALRSIFYSQNRKHSFQKHRMQ